MISPVYDCVNRRRQFLIRSVEATHPTVPERNDSAVLLDKSEWDISSVWLIIRGRHHPISTGLPRQQSYHNVCSHYYQLEVE
jgi:hypothetical protein